jgi:hypothetical protein
VSFLPLTEDVAARFRLPSAPALMWNGQTYVRAFLQCFAHSSPGPLVFWRRNAPVSSIYYNHHNNYRINLDKSLGKTIAVRGTKRGKRLREYQPGSKRTIDDSLDLEFLNVSFRILRRFKYQDKVVRVTLKSPSWLANLQTSAPLGGYLMENGEFFAALPCGGSRHVLQRAILNLSELNWQRASTGRKHGLTLCIRELLRC